MIKLCYKEYDWKLTIGACKKFFELTGLDLQTVYGDYIDAALNMQGVSIIGRMQALAKLYSRDVASKALHCIISANDESIPLAEIEDATFRVSWVVADRPDDLSEPWPLIMLATAYDINEYFNTNLPVKKKADM